MTQGLTDLTNAINAAISEIALLVQDLQTATAGTSDAQLEVLVSQLNTAVTAAQTAISPPATPAP